MENLDYFLFIRLALLLLTGFWIVRKLRAPLRDIVLRLMPVQYRMSESSFNIQTRISTALGIIIAIGVAWGLNWAVVAISDSINPPSTTPTPIPTKPALQPEEVETVPFSVTPNTTPAVPTTTPSAPIPTTPTPYEPSPPTIKSPSSPHYLQVEAFKEETRAWRLKSQLEQQLAEKISLAEGLTPDHAPFKVIVGPFNSRTEALVYKRSAHLDGFPQAAHRLRLLSR